MHFLISNLAEMAGRSTKGVFWQEEELEVMYRFLHQHGYGERVMASTHMETLSIFEEVAQALREAGYHRSASQCRAKFKRDKAEFLDALEMHGGVPPIGCRPARFNLLRRLWDQAGNPSWELRRPAKSHRPKRTCRQAALEESPGSSPHREAVSMESDVQSPEATAEQTSGEGEPSHSGSDQERWRSEIKASLENITKKLDNTVMRTNLLEIGMRRLQRELEIRRLNEAVAAQVGEESGEEESEEAEEEERA
ncbi:UNVERIFIED_CONTAM: hypothetical protein K2H54_059663 [Gekko kuhli]